MRKVRFPVIANTGLYTFQAGTSNRRTVLSSTSVHIATRDSMKMVKLQVVLSLALCLLFSFACYGMDSSFSGGVIDEQYRQTRLESDTAIVRRATPLIE